MTRTRLPALAAALVVVLVACSDPTPAAVQKESAPRPTAAPSGGSDDLSWSACTGKLTSQAGLQCATLSVPVDPAKPDGEQVDLALARQRATGSPSERIGSIVMNPGGPGGSGLEFLAGAASSFPDSLTDHFDLVSFDPRGVGESDPVRCLSDEQKDAQLAGDISPDTDEEWNRAVSDQKELRTACEQRNPELIHHMSTADVASDLDQIRVALGEEQLNYLGYSYGTEIGATYAAMFPTHIRSMVLDGSVSPSSSSSEEAGVQAAGFEHTLGQFVAACDADPSCALAPDAAGAIAATRQSLDTDPVKVTTKSGTRELGRDQFDIGLATALYDTSTWGPTARAIKDIRDGGAQTIFALVDRQVGRQSDGTYDNSSDAQVMVNCSDQTDRPTEADAKAAEPGLSQASPTFGSWFATSLIGCTDWPAPSEPKPAPSAVGAPPILVIGTVGDPATPYAWAEQMSAALTGSVLLTYEGDGHTAFLRGGQCIEDAVVTYFVELTPPAAGTRCPAKSGDDAFGGVKSELIDQLTKSGVSEKLATCIVEGMIADVGESKFDDMVLENDQDGITKLAQAHALSCTTSGGG